MRPPLLPVQRCASKTPSRSLDGCPKPSYISTSTARCCPTSSFSALLREACVCVSTRAARLSAVGIGALLEMIPSSADGCTIAVDGTVFERYPYFKERIEAGLEDMLGKRRARAVELVLAKDGSGVGAAIIAAIANS